MEYDANTFLDSLFPVWSPLPTPAPATKTLDWGDLFERLDLLHERGVVASVEQGRLCFTRSSQLTALDREWIAPNVDRIITLITPNSPPSLGNAFVGTVLQCTDPRAVGGTWNADGTFTRPVVVEKEPPS